ncbi:RNA 3'-terminal phosphate cyclase, partial [Escherichia coli]|nr:RNA 3'-terminal phosphate cyclase [Escherichia coli]
VEVSAGTDNPSAPPADFIRRELEPLMANMGINQQSTLLRHGIYSDGGGGVVKDIYRDALFYTFLLSGSGIIVRVDGVGCLG